MPDFFSSGRERRLWVQALAVVVAIYSTLGLAGTLGDALRTVHAFDLALEQDPPRGLA